MQFKPALGTSCERFAEILEDRPALGTARYIAPGRHLNRPRSESVFLGWTIALRPRSLVFLAAVLVSVLAIFSVRHSPSAACIVSRENLPRQGLFRPRHLALCTLTTGRAELYFN